MEAIAITAVGTLGKDADLRFGGSGKASVSFSMACSHRYKQNDEWVEETTWMPVVAYGSLAENVAASCFKGTRVIVSGRLRSREWDSDDGSKHKVMELIADEIAPSIRFATAEIARNPRKENTR